jgi:hypothetical protein
MNHETAHAWPWPARSSNETIIGWSRHHGEINRRQRSSVVSDIGFPSMSERLSDATVPAQPALGPSFALETGFYDGVIKPRARWPSPS